MKKLCQYLFASALCIIGGMLTFWPNYSDDEVDLALSQSAFMIIQNQLSGIGDCLRNYRDKHGAYPDSNGGLSVLDVFDAKIEVSFRRNSDSESSSTQATPISIIMHLRYGEGEILKDILPYEMILSFS